MDLFLPHFRDDYQPNLNQMKINLHSIMVSQIAQHFNIIIIIRIIIIIMIADYGAFVVLYCSISVTVAVHSASMALRPTPTRGWYAM